MIWKAREIDLSQIQVGSSVSFDVYVDTTLVERFASLSGDYSPLHLDVKYARQSGYDQCVVHGMLMASYFSAIVGMFLPGKSALLISQEIEYIYPVPVNNTLTVSGKVKKCRPALSLLVINMMVIWGGLVVVRGEICAKARKTT